MFDYNSRTIEIMVVDDEIENTHILERILREQKFNVTSSISGAAALELINTKKPDLILLDVKMPGIGGFDLCKTIKENPDTKNLPIIFVTGADSIQDKIKGLEAGGADYISKPFHATEVLLRINNLLQNSFLDRELSKSEQNFRDFFETMDDIILVWDKNGKIIHTNKEGVEKLGYSYHQFKKMSINELITPEKQLETDEIYKKLILGVKNKPIISLIKKDGTKIEFVVKASFGKWNAEECIIGIFKDLSDQNAAYNKFARIFDANPALMSLSRIPDGKYFDVNKAFVDVLGYDKNEVINKTNLELKLFCDPIEQNKMEAMLQKDGKIRDFELCFYKKNGEIITGLFSSEIIDQPKGPMRLNVLTDITYLKKIERELKNSKASSEVANIAKGQFLANMSHEIRTPLNGVLGTIDILSKTNLDSDQYEYIKILEKSAKSLLIIINDILDLSKIEAGRLDINNDNFNLRDGLKDIIKIMQIVAKEKNLDLFLNISPKVPKLVYGDIEKIKQILINLVGNAIKFTETGKIEIKVSFFPSQDNAFTLNFSVNDTGIGIAQRNLGKIFEPFVQADSSTTRDFGGNGLGLAICSKLVELMGGNIWIESTEGVGTKVNFTLNFNNIEDLETYEIFNKAQDENINLVTEAMNSERSQVNGGERPRLKALVVDDNEVNIILMCKILEIEGHFYEVGSNGKQAIKMFAEQDFDIVFMDVQMPEMDGYEATSYIRQLKKGKNIPIVAITAHAMSGDKDKCYKAGMNYYLPKPIYSADLIAILEEIQNDTPLDQDLTISTDIVNIHSVYAKMNHDLNFFKNITQKFKETSSDLLESIDKAIISKDSNELNRLAHALKGSLSAFEAKRAFSLAERLEKNIAIDIGENSEETTFNLKNEVAKIIFVFNAFITAEARD
jgi:PAS domain S-box-containing protein